MTWKWLAIFLSFSLCLSFCLLENEVTLERTFKIYLWRSHSTISSWHINKNLPWGFGFNPTLFMKFEFRIIFMCHELSLFWFFSSHLKLKTMLSSQAVKNERWIGSDTLAMVCYSRSQSRLRPRITWELKISSVSLPHLDS